MKVTHLIALCAGSLLAVPALAQSEPEGKMYKGTPEFTSNIVPGNGIDTDEFVRPPAAPEGAQGMPMPMDTPPLNPNFGSGMAVYVDAKTGKKTYYPESALPREIREYADKMGSLYGAGQMEGAGEKSFGRNMSDLEYISNTEDFPWVVNCEIDMQAANGAGYTCSGTMISPRHFLTAGHCAYFHDDGGWLTQCWVHPGRDGNFFPVGEANLSGYWTWSPWIDNHDYNYDMAWLVLDRPVGALSGWFGYGYNTDCDHYTNDFTWNNASYPAESAYGWTGLYMYYRFGTFDSCPSENRQQYNRAGYGGMSGSSAYKIVDGSRYAHNVASTSDRATYTRHCRFHQASFEWVRDTLIPGDFPNSVDFWPLWCKGDTNVNAGESLSSFSYYVHNNSDAAFNGVVCSDIYLSTNDNISTADTLLGTLCFNWNTGAKGTIFLSYPNTINLPTNLASGTYWVGVITTTADSNSANNDTDGQDALEISFVARPDLDVTAVNAIGNPHNHGRQMTVDYSVLNGGGTSSSGYTVDIRASLNTTISAADPLLGSFNKNSISAGQTENWSDVVTIPDTVTPDQYYIGVIVTSNTTESDTSNNTGYDATQVTIIDLPDMDVTAVDATNGTYDQGDSVPISFSIKNIGSETLTEAYTVNMYASTNTIISTADTLIGSLALTNDIAPNATYNRNTTGTIPGGLADGSYYVGIIIDDIFLEVDTTNNTGYDATRIIVGADCAADFDGNGSLNIFDFLAFQTAFSNGDPDADFDGNGVLNIFDFLAFQTAFSNGC